MCVWNLRRRREQFNTAKSNPQYFHFSKIIGLKWHETENIGTRILRFIESYIKSIKSQGLIDSALLVDRMKLKMKYILHGKCARTVFTHELWRIRNRTSERSERVRFLIQNNECVNTVQSTFHVVLCLLYTYWDWTPSLNYDKLYLNKCGQTTITERKQLRKKRKSSNKIQNLWNKVGLSEFKAVRGAAALSLFPRPAFLSSFCFDCKHLRVNSNCLSLKILAG